MTTTVRDVMTTHVATVTETAGFTDILTVLRRRAVSAVPVLDAGGRVIGVVSEADLLLKEVGAQPLTGSLTATGRRGTLAKASGVIAGDLMTSPPVVTGPDTAVADAARLMRDQRVKRLPVVDDDGHLVGIVSRIDVLTVFGRSDDDLRAEATALVRGSEPAVSERTITVAVRSGIVTVGGHAASHPAALRLVDAIRHIEGVVDVRNRVTYP